MKVPNDIEIEILLRNNTPVDDFLGLTPNQVDDLVYHAFGDRSPVQFNREIDNSTLDRIPLFRLAEEYLKILRRHKHIKLTPLGALPKKVMVELYDKRFLPDELIEGGLRKLWREEDCISIRSARLTVEHAGLVRKLNGKLTLTKAALKLLEANNRLQIFKMFFQSFTGKFNWSFNDGYPEQTIGQFGWGFSIILLDKFGDHPLSVDFYADKYLKAFPDFLSFFQTSFDTVERLFYECYGIRTFARFFVWFGFVAPEKQEMYLDLETAKFTKTELVQRIFRIGDC